MKKTILILLLLVPMLFAQQKVNLIPFVSSNDTILNANPDSLDIQFGQTDLAMGSWEALTEVICSNDTAYVTADDKAAESTKVYPLAQESFWTWSQILRIRIRGSADTLTSKYLTVGDSEGALSLFVQPTIYGDATVDTIIYKVRLGGR